MTDDLFFVRTNIGPGVVSVNITRETYSSERAKVYTAMDLLRNSILKRHENAADTKLESEGIYLISDNSCIKVYQAQLEVNPGYLYNSATLCHNLIETNCYFFASNITCDTCDFHGACPANKSTSQVIENGSKSKENIADGTKKLEDARTTIKNLEEINRTISNLCESQTCEIQKLNEKIRTNFLEKQKLSDTIEEFRNKLFEKKIETSTFSTVKNMVGYDDCIKLINEFDMSSLKKATIRPAREVKEKRKVNPPWTTLRPVA